MRPPLNLAARPFRNERLPNTLAVIAAVALALLTAAHAVALRRVLPDRVAAHAGEVATLDAELRSLRAQMPALQQAGPDRPTLAHWRRLKEVVDRKTFGWTALLAHLEGALPPDVRLTSVQPHWEAGTLELELRAVARSPEAGLAAVERLEREPVFDDVYPLGKSTSDDGVVFEYRMRYRPATAASGPAPAPQEEEADEDEAPVDDAPADEAEPEEDAA